MMAQLLVVVCLLNVMFCRYFVNTVHARPESWLVDQILANDVSDQIDIQSQVFSNLAAGAESGMDFSSRWFADGYARHATTITPHTARARVVHPLERRYACLFFFGQLE